VKNFKHEGLISIKRNLQAEIQGDNLHNQNKKEG